MKRIISSLLAIILLLGVHCVSAQSVQAADKDTVALKFLDALGVLPENFDASQEMTRAEFVDFVITAMKLDGAGSVDTSYFLDVDQSHPYYDSISVASQQGLIQGDEFSLFRPDRIITFEDAVKIATSAIGYAPVAITRGGYAIGYMVVAEQNDLLEHLNSDNTSGNLAGLVYNMLCAPMLSVKSMDADSVKYANSEDDTILSHYWKILKRKGYVTEVGFSTYTGPSTLSAEKVRLDDEVFLVGNTDVEQYFGCNVTYFYEDSDNAGLKKLVYLYPSKAIQEEVILAEDIIDVDLADSNIEYYANGNNKRTNFSKTPYVIYNGVALSNYSREDLKPEYGSIRLMDGDNDGEYEFLFISDMEYVQVGYIDLDKQLICEKTTNRTF